MKKNKENREVALKEANNTTLKTALFSINRVISKGVPSSPAQVGFLMELMTKLSVLLCDEDTTLFTIYLSEEDAVGLWHCLNVALNNEFYTDQRDLTLALELVSRLAVELDKLEVMDSAPSLNLV